MHNAEGWSAQETVNTNCLSCLLSCLLSELFPVHAVGRTASAARGEPPCTHEPQMSLSPPALQRRKQRQVDPGLRAKGGGAAASHRLPNEHILVGSLTVLNLLADPNEVCFRTAHYLVCLWHWVHLGW